MKIEEISEKEFLSILKERIDNIPIWSDKEAIECYSEKELIKVYKKDEILALFLIPLNNHDVRREYRYFPYCMPILLHSSNNLKKKEIYKLIFHYIFNKYDYTFIPLHPTFKFISSIASQSGFVEMRHTHVLRNKLDLNIVSSKLRNHINNAKKNVEVITDCDYSEFDFGEAIKGDIQEQTKRSSLAKKLIDNKKGFIIKAKYHNEIIAGLIVIHDNEWGYLLHSYQKKVVRGVVPLMIYEATKECFDNYGLKYFDFEGSVIDEIDDFFSSFDANIITYPYIIQSNNEKKFFELINRSIKINGRVKEIYEEN